MLKIIGTVAALVTMASPCLAEQVELKCKGATITNIDAQGHVSKEEIDAPAWAIFDLSAASYCVFSCPTDGHVPQMVSYNREKILLSTSHITGSGTSPGFKSVMWIDRITGNLHSDYFYDDQRNRRSEFHCASPKF